MFRRPDGLNEKKTAGVTSRFLLAMTLGLLFGADWK